MRADIDLSNDVRHVGRAAGSTVTQRLMMPPKGSSHLTILDLNARGLLRFWTLHNSIPKAHTSERASYVPPDMASGAR
jgi:hypothetical protein